MTGRAKDAVVAASRWMRRSSYVFRNRFRLGGARIGARFTACFVAIVLSMIAADAVAAWQLSRIVGSYRQLNQADQTSLSIVRVRLDVDTFRDSLAALVSTHDIRQFKAEVPSSSQNFGKDVAEAQRLLDSSSDTGKDPAIRSALETLRVTLPSQLDTTVELASAGDWPAVGLRVRYQVQALINLSSSLVEEVDREVSRQRAEAIESGDRARRQLILVLPVTALLTLFVAVALGWYTTRSITDPLSELEAGARALAQGDFQHQIAIQGEDELAQLGQVFNQTARRLATLYDNLRDNEARLRLTIDTIPAYVWSALPDGSLDFINQRWLGFSGLSAEQGLGWGWEEAVHPEDRDHFFEAWRAAIASGEAMEAEARVRRADGQYRWLLIRNVPLHDETGTIVKWYGTSTDIDDWKRAEQALRQSESYLAEAQRLAHTGSWAWDAATGEYGHWSEEMFRIFGFDPQEGLPTRATVFRQILPEDRDRVEGSLQKSLREKVDTFNEYGMVLPDGTVKHIHIIRHPVLNDAGDLVKLVGTAMDITERKRAEEDLRESEIRFRTFVDHAADAIFVYDLERGTIFDVNPQACEGLGYTRQELVGMNPLAYHLESDSDRPAMESVAERAAAGETVFDTHWHRRKDGTVFPVEVHTSAFWYGGRRFLLKIGRDISDRLRTEEALRERASLLNLTHDAIFVMDMEGVIKYWNRGAEAQYGWTAEQAIGRVSQDMLKTVYPSPLEQIKAEVMCTGRWEGELVQTRQDGTQVVVASRWSLQRGAQGAPVGILETDNDITERKQAEQALQESEANLNRAQEIAHIGSWHLDITGNQLTWSDEVYRMFDTPTGTPLSYEAFLDRVYPEDRERVDRAWTAALQGAPYDIEHRILVGDELKWVRERAELEFDPQGTAAKGIGTVQDITERKRAEEALRRSEAYLTEAQSLSHTGSWAFDLDSNKYIYLSAECLRIFEIDAQQDLPAREAVSRRIHPDDWERVNGSFEKSLREKVDTSTEFRIALPSGTVKHVQVIRHPVLNDAGDVVEMLGTVIDITERKRAEEAVERLRHLEADLRHLNRVSMMGELAASVAHEVNQPISGVVSNGGACLRWLARDVPNVEEAREAARRIVRDGKRAGEIIRHIRALATKRAATNKEVLNLNETIQEVLALVGDEAKKKRVIIRTDFAAGIPPVSGDRVQLQQVALNLVMNAIEAMSSVDDRARELVVTTRNTDADQVLVTVEDSGTGIDPQMIDKIFDSFYTTKPGGMGMGLAISRSILQTHGGRLWAEAKVGPGTLFHFTLTKYHEEGSDTEVAGV